MCVVKPKKNVKNVVMATNAFTVIALILAVVFYAAARFHSEIDVSVEYIDNPSDLIFPSITLCTLGNSGFGNLEDGLNEQFFLEDPLNSNPILISMMSTDITFDCSGRNFTGCRTYNYGNTVSVFSRTNTFVINAVLDESISNPYNFYSNGKYEPKTFFGVLHHPLVRPYCYNNIFYVDTGSIIQALVTMRYVEPIKGMQGWYITGDYHQLKSNLSNENVQIVVQFEDFGYYKEKEYYVYRHLNWIGEVGGFACLCFFLQHTILWIVWTFAKWRKGDLFPIFEPPGTGNNNDDTPQKNDEKSPKTKRNSDNGDFAIELDTE